MPRNKSKKITISRETFERLMKLEKEGETILKFVDAVDDVLNDDQRNQISAKFDDILAGADKRKEVEKALRHKLECIRNEIDCAGTCMAGWWDDEDGAGSLLDEIAKIADTKGM